MAKPISSLSPLGQHIRGFRKANRYGLAGLSELSGVSKVQLWELETNPAPNPRLATMILIAKATKTTLSRIATLAAVPMVTNMENPGE